MIFLKSSRIEKKNRISFLVDKIISTIFFCFSLHAAQRLFFFKRMIKREIGVRSREEK